MKNVVTLLDWSDFKKTRSRSTFTIINFNFCEELFKNMENHKIT